MKDWQNRFRAHMRRHHLSQEAIGGHLGVSQGAVGHWLRGDRDINLKDFFNMCGAAGADPREILFGESSAQAAIETLRTKIATSNPDQAPGYPKFERKLSAKKSRRHKAPTS
jgi:transcriptional regulator with XRE-family HTH domain